MEEKTYDFSDPLDLQDWHIICTEKGFDKNPTSIHDCKKKYFLLSKD